MPRGIATIVIIAVLLAGGAYFLSSSAHLVPLTKIEADVAREPTAH